MSLFIVNLTLIYPIHCKYGTNMSLLISQSSSRLGSDPFASPSRPSQPPTKHKKAPPPRPAPPKSKSPTPFKSSALTVSPSKPKVDPFNSGFGSDPFGGSDPFSGAGSKTNNSNTADPFANFADFSPGKVTMVYQF